MRTDSAVIQRINDLERENQEIFQEKWRMRAIMNGGTDGILAVMLWDKGGRDSVSRQQALDSLGTDLPTVNFVYSSIERTAQMLGRPPTLKAPNADDPAQRDLNENRVHIVNGWDVEQRLPLMTPQLGRWIPGYAFGMLNLTSAKNMHGEYYPKMAMRDPYDVTPGYFGPDQQPADAVVTRVVPLSRLHAQYPELDWGVLDKRIEQQRPRSVGGVIDLRATTGPQRADRQRSWEGRNTGVKVCQYVCDEGTYIVVPEIDLRLHYIPNILDRPSFVFGKRFAFDMLQSHYRHSIGLMAQLAKYNILAMVVSEDAAFRETNIIGKLVGREYERGRLAVNEFEPGTQIMRMTGDQANQMWAQIDRLERQFRIAANYDVQQDGTSPNSFATGAGMRELQAAGNNNIREYQTVMEYMLLDADAIRLEYCEKAYKSQKLKYYDMYGKLTTYRPDKAIKGDYRTRRIYGAMATFDDQMKVVVGLQLLQGDAMDVETFQENIDGFTDIRLMNERIARKRAKDVFFQRLVARSETDPRADAALARIIESPADEIKILIEYFAPEAEEEGQSPMGFPPQPPGLMDEMGAPPEQFSTVLSRLEGAGAGDLGVQTVGQL